MKRYRLEIGKKDGIKGAGIERYRMEDGKIVIEFIGSYYLPDSSNQECISYCIREIIKQLEPEEKALIRIADKNLRHKWKWFTIYPERIEFIVDKKERYKTCKMLAMDALYRKTTITEEME